MWSNILLALWFFLPAGIANATPVFAKKISWLDKLNYPIDFKKELNGIRIFGDNKTFRGLISGIVMAILTAGIMQYIYNNSEDLRTTLGFDFSSINFIVYGFLAGMGALLGDAIKSFFKRRVNIKPGSTWFPFDQIDYIVGGIIFLMPLIMLTLEQYLITFFVWFGMHLISTYIGYLLKLKDKPI
jgi:CDP-2,3-bis-(O-geranylgeranyl)-sn-glycerol synthase